MDNLNRIELKLRYGRDIKNAFKEMHENKPKEEILKILENEIQASIERVLDLENRILEIGAQKLSIEKEVLSENLKILMYTEMRNNY